MKTNSSNTKWWLASVLLPLLFCAAGILVAITRPTNENDWTGASYFIWVIFGLLIGCVLSIACAVVSIRKKENGSFYAVCVSLPSLLWIVYSGVEFSEARRNHKKAAADRIVSAQHEKQKFERMDRWEEKFRTTPRLIMDDDLWAQQHDVDKVANLALRRVFTDPDFLLPEDVIEYILIHFSEDFYQWHEREHVTKSDYERIIRSSKASQSLKEYSQRAIDNGNYAKSEWER